MPKLQADRNLNKLEFFNRRRTFLDEWGRRRMSYIDGLALDFLGLSYEYKIVVVNWL